MRDIKVLGDYIRKYRKVYTALSLNKFAPLVGISLTYMHEIETGKSSCNAETLEKIADALKMNKIAKDELMRLAGKIPADVLHIIEQVGMDKVRELVKEKGSR
jgi:predicted transcriptional regulator